MNKGVDIMGNDYLFKCEDCESTFYIGNEGVKVEYGLPFKTKEGRSIFITYYDCPKCGRRHYVQVDDVRSVEMKKEVSMRFKRLSKKRLDFKDIPKSQNERFKKLNRKLEDYRFELKKKFNNQVLIDNEGLEVEVHFSM